MSNKRTRFPPRGSFTAVLKSGRLNVYFVHSQLACEHLRRFARTMALQFPFSLEGRTEMRDAFPRFAIVLTSLVYMGFAFWLSNNPEALLEAFQIEQSTPQMLTEIPAFYGAIELGIACAMLLLLSRGELFGAALVGGLPLACSGLGRLAGLVLDGYFPLHLGLTVPESFGALTCFIACWQTRRSRSDSPRVQ